MQWHIFLSILAWNLTTCLATHRNNDKHCDDDLCEDSYSRVGYCCDGRCCYRWLWYATWYFWFCLGVFLLMTVGCVSYYCKKAKLKKRRTVGAQRRAIDGAYTSTTMTRTSPQHYNTAPQTSRNSDYPPSYHDVQKTGGVEYKNQYLPYPSTITDAPPPYTISNN